jgi:hypothetical protein
MGYPEDKWNSSIVGVETHFHHLFILWCIKHRDHKVLPIIIIRYYYYHKYEHVFRVTNASFVNESPPVRLGFIRFTFTLDMIPP